MRGTAYAIAEIVVFLAIATFIGIAIGWVLSRMRAPATARTVAAGDDGRAKALAEKVERLEAEKAELAAATRLEPSAEMEGLRKELAQAQWQIRTLEEALDGEGSASG